MTWTYPSDEAWLSRARASAALRVEDMGQPSGIELLPRHASMRRYGRVRFESRSEIVLLRPPPGGPGDEVGSGERTPIAETPFVDVAHWLDDGGVRVPKLFAVDEENDALWLEDVGNVDLDNWVSHHPDVRRKWYEYAIDALLSFGDVTRRVEGRPKCVTARRFDAELLRWELEHFVEWRLEHELGVTLSPGQRAALDREFSSLVQELAAIPTVVMHRDYQSHNLMVIPGSGELVILDFQDAMIGPCVYDAVALLRDSYVALPDSELESLVRRFAEGLVSRSLEGVDDIETVTRWFHLQTVQRKLKDAGRFIYIDRVKNNPAFLRYVEGSLAYVRDAFGRLPKLGRLQEVLSELDSSLA